MVNVEALTEAAARTALTACAGWVAYAAPAAVALTPAAPLIGVRRELRPQGRAALTFDDGPQPGATDRLLDVLARLDVRATFFLVGEQARRFPGLVRAIEESGHEIGNHGYSHRHPLRCSPWDILTDVRRGAEIVEDLTRRPVEMYRPPYGVVTAATLLAAFQHRTPVVLWSSWGRDWRPNATPESIVKNALRGCRDGSVILLHDADHYSGRTWHATIDAVPQLVERLRDKGLAPGPIGGPLALARLK